MMVDAESLCFKRDISNEEIVGTCLSMCPSAEVNFRSEHSLLHEYERSNGRGDKSLCVKEFHRSAAGDTVCKPSDLRPGNILLDTIDYLYLNILPIDDLFGIRYNFLFNRLRSIRQDAVIQQLHQTDVHTYIKILEKCCRFYLYSIYMGNKPKMHIDLHINTTHLQDCFSSLTKLYSENLDLFKENSDSTSTVAANVLINLDSPNILYTIIWNFPKNVRIMEPLNTAIKLYLAYHCKNFVKFQKLVSECITSECNVLLFALTRHIQRLRVETLNILSHSHSSKVCKFPCELLAKWLMLREDGVLDLCKACDVKVIETDFIRFIKSDFNFNKTKMALESCKINEALQKLTIYEVSDCLIGE